MPNNVCICGKPHRNKPIVITVTACKNRHVTKLAPVILSTISSERELTYDKRLKTIPISTPKLSEHSRSKISAPILSSGKILTTTSTEVETVILSTIDSNQDLPCDKCLKVTPISTPKLSEPSKNKISSHTLPSDKIFDITSTDIVSGESTTKNESTNVSVSEEKCKDVSVNAPSTALLQLPLLTPRYHGQGCALEVCVLEKHDSNCEYKKLENESRNLIDDRVGSYEVIGRIKYKTCTKEEKDSPRKNCSCCPADDIPPECLGLPKNDPTVMFAFSNNVHSSNFNLAEYKQMQLKISENISDTTSKSSSFFKYFKKNNSKENKRAATCQLKKRPKNTEVNNFCGYSEVEQLYFHGKCCNKCVQNDQSLNRKWYRSLFSYIRRICKKSPKSENKFKKVSHLK
ncbi:uncharacterized protein [Diabrotica undecimpunctata]|uniref:uncharacterized protein n=1 Tax=Diabrotica undecimpunctata TaxID=50387 RepID=UPI003B63E392